MQRLTKINDMNKNLIKPCLICGKVFKSHDMTSKYCSRKCSQTARIPHDKKTPDPVFTELELLEYKRTYNRIFAELLGMGIPDFRSKCPTK